jgi:GTP:adenosylcobinamide-phosphate guanylyltransferase
MKTEASSIYPEPLDAIVLAGTDDNPRRKIQGQNKALLNIGGQTLVRRVVAALLGVGSVARIFVVGPASRLHEALGGMPERVTVVEQSGKMISNAWEAIHASESHSATGPSEPDVNRPLLFLSSDLPLVSADAIEDFISRCYAIDRESGFRVSMFGGVADEVSLKPYYPDGSGPGIIRPYVHLKECRVRLANIYIGRPRSLSNQAFLQTGFEHRKAEKWKNVLALTWHFLSQSGGINAAWTTLRLQATLVLSSGEGSLYRWLRSRNTTDRIERACSAVLGGTVRMVITPYGGLSLDADNEDDFSMLNQKFEQWKSIDPAG